LIKNLRQLKGYTAIYFLREFRTKNWTRAQILTILKRTVMKLIILLNRPYFGLLYANLFSRLKLYWRLIIIAWLNNLKHLRFIR